MFGLDGCGVDLPGSEQPLDICTQEISDSCMFQLTLDIRTINFVAMDVGF
jgi:hypothetical protein